MTPAQARNTAGKAVDVIVLLLRDVEQDRGADIAAQARGAAVEAAGALAGGLVTSSTIASSVHGTLVTALVEAGLEEAAQWLAILGGAIHAWVAQALNRPLIGSHLQGTADLT